MLINWEKIRQDPFMTRFWLFVARQLFIQMRSKLRSCPDPRERSIGSRGGMEDISMWILEISWDHGYWHDITRPGKRLHNHGTSSCYLWVNPLFRLGHSFSIAFCMFTRGYIVPWSDMEVFLRQGGYPQTSAGLEGPFKQLTLKPTRESKKCDIHKLGVDRDMRDRQQSRYKYVFFGWTQYIG
jgi:hypothetical protein